MEFDLSQLAALSAAVSEGTFEGAARVLHVTPSAVSQRLKALEQAAGRVLVVRSKPVRVTPSGQPVLRLARQVALLTADAHRDLDGDVQPVTIPLAINADSLATWVLDALAPLAGSLCFDIHREDQERTSTLLRDGTVTAAITSDAEPVPGCTSTRLGKMRYRPMAAPDFLARWFPAGPSSRALTAAPVVVFDRYDDLQHRYLRRRIRLAVDVPTHVVPSSADYVAAVRLGLGWGMLPDLQSANDEAQGRLVELDPRGADITLYWQQWRLRSAALDDLAAAILAAARRRLIQPTGRAARRAGASW